MARSARIAALARSFRMRSVGLIALGALLLPAAPAHAAARAVPYTEGPDVPAAGSANAVLTPFVDERWSFTEETRNRTVTVPTPPAPATSWSRIVLEYSNRPDGDPWDRLYTVSVGGVEVLRGTTPRTAFTVRRDITEYAALLPPGKRVRIGTSLGSWVGALLSSVKLSFYAAEPQVHAPAGLAVPALSGALGGDGSSLQSNVLFPDAAPTSAVVDVYLSGHGQGGEFWYQYGGPPDFHLYVGAQEVATLTAMPYTYALIGCDPGCDTEHQVAWWTAQQGLDAAGVHTGTGEIAPYRATLDAADLGLLRGATTVKIVETGRYVVSNPGSYWPVSATFLLNGVADNCPTVANADQADADHDGVGDACDGPVMTDATSVLDGGPLSDGDVVTVTYPGPIASCANVDPAQFTYGEGTAGGTAASAVSCDGSNHLLVTFANRFLRTSHDGVLRYTESAVADRRLVIGGEEAADGDAEPVAVSVSDRPFMTGAGATADPTEPDEVHIGYTEPVDCTSVDASQFIYRTNGSTTPAWSVDCDGGAGITVTFPDGTVDAQFANPVIRYDTTGGTLADAGGAPAISPDEVRVGVSKP